MQSQNRTSFPNKISELHFNSEEKINSYTGAIDCICAIFYTQIT